MKVIGFDGRTYSLSLDPDKVKGSSLHQKARQLIKEIYPYDSVYEEITLKGSKTGNNKVLFADFLLPSRRMIVEVHGKQHYEFNLRHYDNKMEFYQAQARDRVKKEWCELNNLILIVLNYNEDIETWTKKLKEDV